MILRAVTAGLLTSGIALVASPAVAAPATVSLVVGTEDGAYTVEVPAGQVAKATDRIKEDPDVSYVEPDHVARISAITPNDPAFKGQWGIAKTGVSTAWETTRGRSTVTVAVVDTGVTAIPDLTAHLLPGHDFVNNDDDATDDQGHGTMTAGVIAATGNNGVGIAGICWTCKILPVKVLGADGSGSYSTIAEGIRWAAGQGSDIINLSLGGDSDSQVLRDAVAYAADKGSLVIAAAGNEGSSAPHYPAAIASVLAVGGATEGDLRYPWSNYGADWVDIAAPGCNLAQSRAGIVGQFCGTSSATPFVSGVAALIASTSPAPEAAEIRTAITSTADDIAGNWVPGRIDAAQALTFQTSLPVTNDAEQPVTAFVSPSGNAVVRGTVAVTARAADNTGITKVELLVNGKIVGIDKTIPYGFSWRSTAIKGATVTLGLRATDRGGNVSTASRRVTVDNGAPIVRITKGSASGTHHVRKTKYVTATATDRNGVRSMELLINGRVVQRSTGATKRFAVQTWKFGKTLSIRVRAYDRAGNASLAPARKWYR